MRSVKATLDSVEQSLQVRKTGSIIETVDDAYNFGRRIYQTWHNKTRWSVSVSSDDRLYDIVLRWLLSDEADTKPARNLKASYIYGRGGKRRSAFFDEADDQREPGRVELTYNESTTRRIVIDGHRVQVLLHRPDTPDGGEAGDRYRPSQQPHTLIFSCSSRDGQQAIVDHLRVLAADQEKRKPALYLMDMWGGWNRRNDLPQRQVESVVLKAGQMERLQEDIQSFLEAEPEYVRRGMPYHRGYMLYGPPGTGKTSIVRALAAHFGLDLWYAALGDLEKDTSLMALVNGVGPGSILLLEDIDVYHATRERDDEQRGASMAGLLNALDGVATPHGLITFMTTNDIDVIDEALLRPGRVDVCEEVGYPDQDQVVRLFNFWYETDMNAKDAAAVDWTGTPADLVELFKGSKEADALTQLQKGKPKTDERSVSGSQSGGKKNGNGRGRRQEARS